MNVRAACNNQQCSQFGIEKSVAVGQMWGFGAPHDRVKCVACGELMKTTETIDTSSKGRGKTGRGREVGYKRLSKRPSPSRSSFSKKPRAKRLSKRRPKRD
jgi:hypothetical protein